MARYRKVDSRIWNDAKFRSISDNGKLVFLMLLTHPSMTALGAMRASEQGLAAEMGWSQKAFREAFREALAKGMAKHDQNACLVVLPNFLKYNRPESPNVVKAWESALDLLPECSLKSQLIHEVKGFVEGLSEGFQKALPEAFAKALPYQEQEQEQEQEQDKPPMSGKPDDGLDSIADQIIDYLNDQAGKRFQHIESNRKFIRGRLQDGATPRDCALVIKRKVQQWKGTDKEIYLRPETLFNPTKFQAYINEPDHQLPPPGDQGYDAGRTDAMLRELFPDDYRDESGQALPPGGGDACRH